MLTAEPRLRRVEQGNFAQRALRRGFYPAMLRTPIRDQILFISWKGKQCGDNPLGIAEELRRRGDDREQLWTVTDWSVPVPDGGTGVLRGTQEYYEALARSKYLVSNDDMQAPFRKRGGQVYLQTWHGTLLKKIGFDIANPQFISGTAYFDHLAKDVAQWDLLLSPNPFSTPRLLLRRGDLRVRVPPQRPAAPWRRGRDDGPGPGTAGLARRQAGHPVRADLARQPGLRERPQVPV
jgi:CDP-glycerol glycerophosphotransferase